MDFIYYILCTDKVQVVPVDLRPKRPLVYRVSQVNF